MTPQTTPTRLTLKRDEKLEITWQDGRVCSYPIAYLRKNCPCAQCKEERAKQAPPAPAAKGKISLNVLKGAVAERTGPLVVADAQKVGNYAIRLVWSDGHDTGIYSFHYLREICPDPSGD